jgi:simple sugar transport system permease protein
VVRVGSDQIIAGTAVTLLALGLTGTLYQTVYGARGAALTVPTAAPLPVPG